MKVRVEVIIIAINIASLFEDFVVITIIKATISVITIVVIVIKPTSFIKNKVVVIIVEVITKFVTLEFEKDLKFYHYRVIIFESNLLSRNLGLMV